MRRLAALIALSACVTQPDATTTTSTLDFEEVVGAWDLEPVEGEPPKTKAGLTFGERRLDLGELDGRCAPTAKLPFTEVQGQPAFAGLLCTSPDGGTHHAVLVEVPGEDPAWPAPAALGLVLTRQTAPDKVALLTAGAVEVPLGVIPRPPVVTEEPAFTPAASADTDAPASDTDG